MQNKIIKCTSNYCPYRKTCARQIRSDPIDNNEISYNYEYSCNSESSFESFTPRLNKGNI
jgi:hypothetical protein